MKRFLVIRLSHLGDVILTEPVVRSIRSAVPNAEIVFLTKASYRDVVDLFDGINKILTLDIPGRDASLFGLSSTLRSLGTERYDAVLDLHGNLRSWLAKYQIKSRRVVTYNKNRLARSRAVSKKRHEPAVHTVDLYLSTLERIGIPVVARIPNIAVEKDARGIPGRYAILAVGASHPAKHFPLNQWLELAAMLSESLHLQVVVVEEERWEYLNVFDDLVGAGKVRIVTGLPIRSLASLIAASALTVSNDSGVMHLSAALGVPTLGLFGPTHPVLGFSPLGDRCRAVTLDAECSPCSLHGESDCYRVERFCFTMMSTEKIMRNVKEVLQDSNA